MQITIAHKILTLAIHIGALPYMYLKTTTVSKVHFSWQMNSNMRHHLKVNVNVKLFKPPEK